MKKKVKLLHLNNYNIYDQLILEESLLENEKDSFIIINKGSKKSIVLGISNEVNDLIHLDKVGDIPLIKRFSGGGCVVVDEDTIFLSFIFSKKDLNLIYPEEIHRWIASFFQKAFKNISITFEENDLIYQNKKIVGSAQYIKKNKWLHHTSVLWDYTKENMNILKIPKKMPSYREKRSHEDFLFPLKKLFKDKKMLIDNFLEALKNEFLLEKVYIEKIDLCKKKEYRTKIL